MSVVISRRSSVRNGMVADAGSVVGEMVVVMVISSSLQGSKGPVNRARALKGPKGARPRRG